MASMTRWPDWMPLPQQDSYTYEPIDRRTSTDMEVGTVRRVNFDTDETKITCDVILNQLQSAWFETFERSVLAQGSQWFEMPLQSGGQIEWHSVRFQSRPKASIKAPTWTQYRLTLECAERPFAICPEVVEMLLCVGNDDICVAAENLRRTVHDILPEAFRTWDAPLHAA